MILCKVIRDTLQSNTYYLGKYHVLLFLTSKSRNSAVVIVCSKKF